MGWAGLGHLKWTHGQLCAYIVRIPSNHTIHDGTGVNPAKDAGDTSPPIFFVGGDVNGNIPPILLRTFGYSRPILVALRLLSLKPISFGYKTPPIRFSQAGGQSAHKARPPNLQLALTPLLNGCYESNPAIHGCGVSTYLSVYVFFRIMSGCCARIVSTVA